MTGRDIFKIWAPAGVQWVGWVRPVPFAAISSSHNPNATLNVTLPPIMYNTEPQQNTAIIVDTPGADSVKEGIALAKLGFRPIPLYNGPSKQENAMALVDSDIIESALKWGALELEKITIPPNAPPAFLLDSNRTQQYKMDVSVFDNSWDIYNQDMPSASYLLCSGISRIIIRGEAIQKDLSKLLYKFQKNGIEILYTDGYTPPQKVTIKKPPRKNK